MTAFWRNWFLVWCLSIGLFARCYRGAPSRPRAVLSGWCWPGFRARPKPCSIPPCDSAWQRWGPCRWAGRFPCVSLFVQPFAQGAKAKPLWAGMISWFLIDSAFSVSTGFGLNVLPNVVLAGIHVVGLLGSGVLKAKQTA